MKKFTLSFGTSVFVASALVSMAAHAQNVAVVNGKAVPKSRVEALVQQVTKQGQPRTEELERQVRDEVVRREILEQEAVRQGVAKSTEYKNQLELARQGILIRELIAQFKKKNPVTDAEARAEYDKFKGQATGTEYRARHILVEKEDEALALIKQIKGGASFEDLAKKSSKDPGSAEKGGDLDFAAPGNYVPEFSEAMIKLKKGELTETPVKTQFGYHIIKLEDTRDAQFPAFEDVKAQIEQSLDQKKTAEYLEGLRAKAKTDYKFAQ